MSGERLPYMSLAHSIFFSIAEKLRELDYEPEDYPVNDLDFHAMFEQRAALTPRSMFLCVSYPHHLLVLIVVGSLEHYQTQAPQCAAS